MVITGNDGISKRTRASIPRGAARKGVIVPLFAITLPALLLLCCIALNVAQFRMLRTELKVAADASAHAAGRAMSYYQDVDKTIAFAKQIGAMNRIGNKPFVLEDSQVVFGRSIRSDESSRYQFTSVETESVRKGTVVPNSVGIRAQGLYPVLLAAISGRNTIPLEERSVATQADRDIILVLDRSGSMMDYKDDQALDAALYDLYRAGRISRSEYNNARDDNNFSSNVANRLPGDMQQYAVDKRNSSLNAPRHSRWAELELGVAAFFDVVEKTEQSELVGLVTFSSSSGLDVSLNSNYSGIKSKVDEISPTGKTAIGQGLQSAVPELFTSSRARPFASKTIVVLTDGQNNVSPDPEIIARDIKNKYNVTIHTITLSVGLDVSPMERVAAIGGGKHYHSDTGENLVPIFREIANNLPTLLTQ